MGAKDVTESGLGQQLSGYVGTENLVNCKDRVKDVVVNNGIHMNCDTVLREDLHTNKREQEKGRGYENEEEGKEEIMRSSTKIAHKANHEVGWVWS